VTTLFVKVDNLHYKQNGAEVPAAHTVRVTWQVDNGPVLKGELDLSEDHLAQYGAPVQELLAASNENQRSEAVPVPEKGKWPGWPWRPAGVYGHKPPRDWGKAIRAYVDGNELRAMNPPDRPAYATPGSVNGGKRGGTYWPHWVVRSFVWWCETGEVRTPESEEEAEEFLWPYPGELGDIDGFVITAAGFAEPISKQQRK
jgi:hypothetical protein